MQPTFEKDPTKTSKGVNKKPVIKKVLNDKALKIAIFSGLSTFGILHFQSKIQALLLNNVFKNISARDVTNRELKITCDIIQKQGLNFYTESMRSSIVSNNSGKQHKINLLKT